MKTTSFPNWGVIIVSGNDRAEFLHNQLSNDIKNLAVGQGCFATYNTPQGRVRAHMTVAPDDNNIYMIVSCDLLDVLVERLQMFVLRSDVKLSIAENLSVTVTLPENEDLPYVLPQEPVLSFPVKFTEYGIEIHLPHGGIVSIVDIAKSPLFNQEIADKWRYFEIIRGFPHICKNTSNLFVAQMLNQHLLGGVHFRKGCYPGQEIIARSQYIGEVKRGLVICRCREVLEAGCTILDEGKNNVGTVLDSVRDADRNSVCLCVIKYDAVGKELITADGLFIVRVEDIFFRSKIDYKLSKKDLEL
ncbi:MAG: folate-binding protein YgfZ [Neisseriaceae bacterium]|nr:folate-binding protein YgfZ [Neisseriaceae bacterium]